MSDDTNQDQDSGKTVDLDHFCAALSKRMKNVALIGGFHHTEVVAGRRRDTTAAFQTRFDAFAQQPNQ